MKKRNYIPLRLLFAALALTILAGGCDWGGAPDPEPIPQTRILEIRLTPDTVAVGDTVLIHAVIEDSLDPRFEFFWGKDEGRYLPKNGTLNGPKIRWHAKGFEYLESGEVERVLRSVRTDNGSEDSVDVSDTFQIPVIGQ